ncbi:MAG: helix-turn-helix domain-containing protein [Desulfurococcales archaeon]|nr:helix-turn-helix domain-containing protein [Desulfurococcales archaeon]
MGLDIQRLPKKEGIIYNENEGVLYVIGYRNVAKVAKALASETRTRIIDLLRHGPQGLDNIADEVNQSKANISGQIRKLEEIGVVAPIYQPGERGIKKLVELKVKAIVLVLDPEKIEKKE